ncbi:hypothetical protein Avbf_17313 [Armadillidium vulgare]|nr:hypothetical protein Avbf_17313 [Armadillidium vulgare]
MDIEFETASTNRHFSYHITVDDINIYSVTPILADLLKEPSGCFENFCNSRIFHPIHVRHILL